MSAVVVGLAGLTAVGGGDSAHAELKTNDNFGSKEAFKQDCKGQRGEFVDSPENGVTVCVYDDGSMRSCDQQGNNCVYTPRRSRRSPAGRILSSVRRSPLPWSPMTHRPSPGECAGRRAARADRRRPSGGAG
jgi:hypothetical protein